MDEVKIIKSSNSKSSTNRNLQSDIIRPYSSHSKIQIYFTETSDRTMSSPVRHCPAPPGHCLNFESDPNG
jgi:hypothetical protein